MWGAIKIIYIVFMIMAIKKYLYTSLYPFKLQGKENNESFILAKDKDLTLVHKPLN